MSQGLTYLHSHSGIEKEMTMPKSQVVIDNKYGDLFGSVVLKTIKHKGATYLVVPTVLFIKKGGVFKNLKL